MPPPQVSRQRKKTASANDLPLFTRAMMEALAAAGGADYLKGIAEKDPKTFCALLVKALPQGPASPSEIGITLVWQQDPSRLTMLENEPEQ